MKNRSPQVRKARAFAKYRRAGRNVPVRMRVYCALHNLLCSWVYNRRRYAEPLQWPVFAPQPGDIDPDPDEMPF